MVKYSCFPPLVLFEICPKLLLRHMEHFLPASLLTKLRIPHVFGRILLYNNYIVCFKCIWLSSKDALIRWVISQFFLHGLTRQCAVIAHDHFWWSSSAWRLILHVNFFVEPHALPMPCLKSAKALSLFSRNLFHCNNSSRVPQLSK